MTESDQIEQWLKTNRPTAVPAMPAMGDFRAASSARHAKARVNGQVAAQRSGRAGQVKRTKAGVK